MSHAISEYLHLEGVSTSGSSIPLKVLETLNLNVDRHGLSELEKEKKERKARANSGDNSSKSVVAKRDFDSGAEGAVGGKSSESTKDATSLENSEASKSGELKSQDGKNLNGQDSEELRKTENIEVGDPSFVKSINSSKSGVDEKGNKIATALHEMIKNRSTGFRTWQACTGERFQLRVKKGLQSNRSSTKGPEASQSNTEVTPTTAEDIFEHEQAQQRKAAAKAVMEKHGADEWSQSNLEKLL